MVANLTKLWILSTYKCLRYMEVSCAFTWPWHQKKKKRFRNHPLKCSSWSQRFSHNITLNLFFGHRLDLILPKRVKNNTELTEIRFFRFQKSSEEPLLVSSRTFWCLWIFLSAGKNQSIVSKTFPTLFFIYGNVYMIWKVLYYYFGTKMVKKKKNLPRNFFLGN